MGFFNFEISGSKEAKVGITLGDRESKFNLIFGKINKYYIEIINI